MLNENIEKAINEQINAEIYSAYLYYSMSAYFESINLEGAASWMRSQAAEELTHAHKFFTYVNDRGGQVLLTALNGPPTEWESPLATFQAAYEHEVHVTSLINALVTLALKENDHTTNNFLQWFVAEQIEEEATADSIVQKLKRVTDSPSGLFMVDQELGQRTFVMPPDLAGAA
ncbi:ferritin [Planctomycetota bacterium]